MSLSKSLLFKIKPLHIFVFFVVLHLALLNINAAEWGDSYRILRASEYIREFSYPQDEKRPPLFSMILAIRPAGLDQVLWGRIVMFGVSILAFYLFYKLADHFFEKDTLKKNLALLLFVLNPVYLYWSIRLMADVPLSALAMAVFYVLVLAKSNKIGKFWSVLLGFVVGLAILIRFEGYILFGAAGLGILFLDGFDTDWVKELKKRLKPILLYVVAVFITILPWTIYRNPLTSSYFEEQTSRDFNLGTLIIYLLSAMFLFGFTSACYFFAQNYKNNIKFSKEYVGITVFVLAELFIALWWPAAMPRLFVPIIPFLVLMLAASIVWFFEKGSVFKKKYYDAAFLFALLGAFVLGQYYFKLQFLVSVKAVFVVAVLVNLANAYFIIKERFTYFTITLLLSLLIWSLAVICVHKDIFGVVKDANVYAVNNLEGRIGHNDVSSVSDWYLNQKSDEDSVEGIYYDAVEKENRSKVRIAEKSLDYLLITNEHNTDTTIDLSPWPHLIEVVEFSKEINGKIFFTKIVRVEK